MNIFCPPGWEMDTAGNIRRLLPNVIWDQPIPPARAMIHPRIEKDHGWICPKCKKGKAPHVETCDCS